MTPLTCFWGHVHAMATQVSPGRILNKQRARIGASQVPIVNQMVKVRLLKLKPFVSAGLVVLQSHVVPQLLQFSEQGANSHEIRPSEHDIPPPGVFE